MGGAGGAGGGGAGGGKGIPGIMEGPGGMPITPGAMQGIMPFMQMASGENPFSGGNLKEAFMAPIQGLLPGMGGK